MQQVVIARLGNDPATARDNQTAALAHIARNLRLDGAKRLFAIFRKNVSNRFTGRFGNIVINIDEFAAELLGEQRANSALAAPKAFR